MSDKIDKHVKQKLIFSGFLIGKNRTRFIAIIPYVFFILSTFLNLSYADSVNNSQSIEALIQSQEQKKAVINDYFKSHPEIISKLKLQAVTAVKQEERDPVFRSMVDQRQKQITTLTRVDALGNPENVHALILVSFNMPNQSLIETLIEAHALHIPVLIRGLVNNSFPETVSKMLSLMREASKEQVGSIDGVSIDPRPFRKYQIEQVPAVIVEQVENDGGDSQEEGEVKKDLNSTTEMVEMTKTAEIVYGDISIENALNIIAKRQGTAACIECQRYAQNMTNLIGKRRIANQ